DLERLKPPARRRSSARSSPASAQTSSCCPTTFLPVPSRESRISFPCRPWSAARRSREMARMTGGEALVKQLYREGVRVVFGLPGVQFYGVVAALRDEPGIRFVVTRHEQATSYMADGYARAVGAFVTALVV